MRRWLTAIVCAAAIPTIALHAQAPDRDTILQRAGLYVATFIEQFSNVVAEEVYVQDSLGTLPVINTGRGGALANVRPASRTRETKSDFLLVKIGDNDFLPFRDVYEVDGQKVRDREGRLAKLFLNPTKSSLDQAGEITQESARYNLGALQRTINTPIFALVNLQLESQPKFRYSLGKRDPQVGENVWIVEFKELQRPTFVHGLNDTDIPSNGRAWIDAETGRIAKTELLLDTPGVRARITTSFRHDEKFQIDVPFEMSERYALDRGTVSATATYSHFRRFDVTSDENFKDPAVAQVTMTDRKTGMTLVEIGSGRYSAGSPATEAGRGDDETVHDITLNRPFFLGKNEVTQQEWRTLMSANPSRFADCGPRCPVERVTFAEAEQFVAALNAQPDRQLAYRLPTEAEWEYACRAGSVTPFSTGEVVTTAQANFNGRKPYGKGAPGMFRERTTRVGGFPANAWGLIDMHGNVAEWTADWYGASAPEDTSDPTGPSSGDRRSVRGGSWQGEGASIRCAARSALAPDSRDPGVGLRIAGERLAPAAP